jgi:hypothetical protein
MAADDAVRGGVRCGAVRTPPRKSGSGLARPGREPLHEESWAAGRRWARTAHSGDEQDYALRAFAHPEPRSLPLCVLLGKISLKQ